MFILLGFALTIVDDINRNFNGMVEEELEGYSNFIFSNQWIAPLFFFLSVAIISFIYSLVSTLLRNYHLHLELQEKGLKLIKGLINQEEISINKNKVQIIGWSDNPIRRLFKMWTINLEQASSTDANQLKSKITIPGSYIKQVNRVISEVFPRNIKYPMIEYGVSKLLLYRLVWYGSLLPFLLSMLSYFWIGWHVLWFMAWPLFHIPYVYFYYKKRSFEVSEEILKNNKGVFGNHYEMVQLHKIQGVEIKQSWYQRRKEVANLELFTAAGSLRIPFIPLEQAISLEKYVLYRIETDTRAWM
jgi:putative membrane protein